MEKGELNLTPEEDALLELLVDRSAEVFQVSAGLFL